MALNLILHSSIRGATSKCCRYTGGEEEDWSSRMLALLGPRRRDLPFLSVQPLLYLRAPSLFVDTTHIVALSHACSAVSFLFFLLIRSLSSLLNI